MAAEICSGIWYHRPHALLQPIRSTMPLRFQRVRRSRLLRALKWLCTRPFFWAVIIVILILNWSYGQLAPHTVSVPIVRQGGDVIVDGQHFGAEQGNSYLVFNIDQQPLVIEDA